MLKMKSKNTWVVCYLHCAVLMEYLQCECIAGKVTNTGEIGMYLFDKVF